jgi:hypothetical protein
MINRAPSTNVIIQLQFFYFFTAWKKLQKTYFTRGRYCN